MLLDDCLAAVDSHVARHVFGEFTESMLTKNTGTDSSLDNIIGPKGLLASKARILVTNSISFVKQLDQLVYLRRGIVLESGSYDSIVNDTSSEMYKLLWV